MDFFKFPTTPHLADLGTQTIRGDKVMTKAEQDAFLENYIWVEEKVDGANLGISFDSEGRVFAQNRGAFLERPASGQWRELWHWLDSRLDCLASVLKNRYILFGEWCFAKHYVAYDKLPDWFLGFDIFDRRTRQFFSTQRRNRLFQDLWIKPVPTLGHGKFTLAELEAFFGKSRFSNAPSEGLYLRHEQDDWLIQRSKLVHPGFQQAIEKHWSRKRIEVNRLAIDTPRVAVHPFSQGCEAMA